MDGLVGVVTEVGAVVLVESTFTSAASADVAASEATTHRLAMTRVVCLFMIFSSLLTEQAKMQGNYIAII